MIYFIIIIFVFIVFLWIYLIFKYNSNKKIDKNKKIFFYNKLKRIKSNFSIKESIIDYDKLYHKILLELGYNWSFGEILKSKPKEIWNINKIWELHKIRNKLVHDFDLMHENILRKKKLEYEKEINVLLR